MYAYKISVVITVVVHFSIGLSDRVIVYYRAGLSPVHGYMYQTVFQSFLCMLVVIDTDIFGVLAQSRSVGR